MRSPADARSVAVPPAWSGAGLAVALAAAGALVLPTARPAAADLSSDARDAGCVVSGRKVTCAYTEPAEVPVVFRVPPGVVKVRLSVRGGSGGSGDADQPRECLGGTASRPGGGGGGVGGVGGYFGGGGGGSSGDSAVPANAGLPESTRSRPVDIAGGGGGGSGYLAPSGPARP